MYLIPSRPIEGKIIYIAKSYRTKTGSSTTKNLRRLGTLAEIREREAVSDAWAWARSQVELANTEEKENRRKVTLSFSPDKVIKPEEQRSFNLGYLTLDKIYHEMGLGRICSGIERRSRFHFDLGEIMRQLVMCRILWPASKLETWKLGATLALVKPVKLWDIYRALIVVGDNLEYLQQRLFHYSCKALGERNTSVVYYDCTNFFYESVRETDLRKPGASKENRRTPIVQMGIFMDADGLPLAFNINPGNTNEQTTLRPLEKMIDEKMNIDEFVMCTDAGLSSGTNRVYNDTDRRKFITVQSVKTLPNKDSKEAKKMKVSGKIKDWALADDGWRMYGDAETLYTLEQIKDPKNKEAFHHKTFYKERWYPTWVQDKETGFETRLDQRLIVTFSLKFMEYHRNNRMRNIEKAIKAIENGNAAESAKSFRSFIKPIMCTDQGEIAEKEGGYQLDLKRAEEEAVYDGFYAVCTNLKQYTDKLGNTRHSVEELIRINRARWEIEYLFRIMKTEFKARPVYLQNDKAIKAHFAICFVALFIYRVLENRMGDGFTTEQILDTLRGMNAQHIQSEGFIPSYKRTAVTDKLFEISGFRLDTEIVMLKIVKSVIASQKERI